MIFVTDLEKQKILASAVKAREEELLHYQINIDNYRIAISNIKELFPAVLTAEERINGLSLNDSPTDVRRVNALLFAEKLESLLLEHILEYDKAHIMLQVLLGQLQGVDIKSLVKTNTQI